MALKGDLASVDLAQVFQMLALNKKVGLLSIQSPKLWKVLYFDARGVTLYYNSYRLLDRTLAAFVRSGRLQARAVEELRDHASRNQLGLTDALLAGGYLGEDELDGQMRYEIEEEIYDLFFCKDARFEFFEGVDRLHEREGVVDERFFFNTESVIMEAARRIDEWSYIAERIPNSLEVFTPSDHPFQPAEGMEECAAVWELVDGRRNVSRLVEVSGLSSFAVFKSLCQMYDAGHIVPLPPEEVPLAGNECLAEGRVQDAIALYERAIDLGVGVPEVHFQAAQAYQAIAEYENAIYHLKCDAEYRIAAGDFRGAAQRLHAAAALISTDLAARERLVEIVLDHAEIRLSGYDALEEGKVLVELMMAAGDLPRVRAMLERLLSAHPEDLELKKVLINVHTKAGDQAKVVELYESIADTLVRQHRPLEAVGFLQKILMLDRTRSDVSEKLRTLYALDERSRSRRRAMAMLGVLFLLLSALGVAYHFYDEKATEVFEAIEVDTLLADNEFALAAGEYEAFLAHYPLSTARERAREELARIESLRLKHEAMLANQRSAREREVAKLRLRYKEEWARHADLFRAGDPEGALLKIEAVRELVREAGGQDDIAWALEQQVEKNFEKIRTFLDAAADLEQRGNAELAQGNFQRGRELLLDLAKNYEITKAARRSRVPVQIVSRPSGARILRGGQPIVVRDENGERPLTTPAIVLCSSAAESLRIELDGFVPAAVEVAALAQASVEVPLKIVANGRVHFSAPVQTEAAIGGGWLVGGLKGGKVGVADLRTGAVRHEINLAGLKAMDGTPAIVADRVYFFSNERTLECYLLETGTSAPNWPVRLPDPTQTEMVARDGRVLFVDRANVLRGFDQGSARALFAVPLEGAPAGPPTIDNRIVRVATVDGRIVRVDAGDGRLIGVLRSPAGITSRPSCLASGTLWFAGADSFVRAVDENTGRIRWAQHIGRSVADNEIAVSPDGVFVLGTDNRLLRLDLETGRELGTTKLEGVLARSGLRVGNGRLHLVISTTRDQKRTPDDVLQVLEATGLSLLWEFGDRDRFTGGAGLDGRQVAIVGQDGDVVLFR